MKPQNSKETSINNRLPALYKKLDNLYLCGQLATADIDAIIQERTKFAAWIRSEAER